MAIKYGANFAELKSAIEDSVTTEIEATADITFVSGGAILIPVLNFRTIKMV